MESFSGPATVSEVRNRFLCNGVKFYGCETSCAHAMPHIPHPHNCDCEDCGDDEPACHEDCYCTSTMKIVKCVRMQ